MSDKGGMCAANKKKFMIYFAIPIRNFAVVAILLETWTGIAPSASAAGGGSAPST
jgi:hypothetical protein